MKGGIIKLQENMKWVNSHKIHLEFTVTCFIIYSVLKQPCFAGYEFHKVF
jgi:hypothetical protein